MPLMFQTDEMRQLTERLVRGVFETLKTDRQLRDVLDELRLDHWLTYAALEGSVHHTIATILREHRQDHAPTRTPQKTP